MQRATLYIVLAILLSISLVSCNDQPSLQRYFVDNQESANFISQDIPLSMIKIDQSNFTEEQQEAYNSVKRLNFLGYKATENNKVAYDAEIAKVKAILKDDKYNDLMDFNTNGNKFSVKYVGDDDEADEVVVFGSSGDMGFAVVRLLGNDMSPDKMATLANALQSTDFDQSAMDDIVDFFK